MRHSIKDAQHVPNIWNKAHKQAAAQGFNPYDNHSTLRSSFDHAMDSVGFNEVYSEYTANLELTK